MVHACTLLCFLVYFHCECRFIDGLKTLGVLQAVRNNPEAFRTALCCNPATLTADLVDELFSIRWSASGSNNRTDENRVVAYWRDYLQDAEGR